MLRAKKCVNGANDSKADSLIHIRNKYGVAVLPPRPWTPPTSRPLAYRPNAVFQRGYNLAGHSLIHIRNKYGVAVFPRDRRLAARPQRVYAGGCLRAS